MCVILMFSFADKKYRILCGWCHFGYLKFCAEDAKNIQLKMKDTTELGAEISAVKSTTDALGVSRMTSINSSDAGSGSE